jgi:NAD kinase
VLDRVVVVTKPTKLESLIATYGTESHAQYYLESRGESYELYETEHKAYHAAVASVLKQIPRGVPSQILERDYVRGHLFEDREIVAVVGEDGMFVNAAKYVGRQPVIVVNPDTRLFSGVLASCEPKGFGQILRATLEGKQQEEQHTMAQATLDNGQALYAINDLFIGRADHVSARYAIQYQGRKERQSSSGIIVTTGTGSTGWMKSVAEQVKAYGGSMPGIPFERDANHLFFNVREPYPSNTTGTSIVFGKVTQPLRISSEIPEGGVIFSDGMQKDYIAFNSGSSVAIQAAKERVRRVVA